ncbi:MAG: hypothetical protein RBG13Loki_2930 [Promethearchaeota archaeon CR_4]|nr:MAG: hypothetical protein RBG13Loki_2930 [Candidatus Lokiarchaeota archaeon CR_4]
MGNVSDQGLAFQNRNSNSQIYKSLIGNIGYYQSIESILNISHVLILHMTEIEVKFPIRNVHYLNLLFIVFMILYGVLVPTEQGASYSWVSVTYKWLAGVNISLCILSFGLGLDCLRKIRRFQKNRPTKLRHILITAIIYLILAQVSEILYTAYIADWIVATEYGGLFQFGGNYYILLDILVTIIIILMTFFIFLDNQILDNPKIATWIIGLLFSFYILCYFLLFLFAYYPTEYLSTGQTFLALVILIVIIIAFIIIVNVSRLRKRVKVKDLKHVLLIINTELILVALIMICVLIQGMTVPAYRAGNPWPNRLIAIVRDILTILFLLSIYPVYIKPHNERPV